MRLDNNGFDLIDGYCTPGVERETRLPADELLESMDKLGIARAVIAPEDRELAVYNRAGNDRMLKLAEEARGRFIPACTVNPWYGQDGCEELRRAVEQGARMLVLAPALQGFLMGDELAKDLLLLAGRLGVPVYVHMGPHSYGAPTQLALEARRYADTRFILGHCGSTDYFEDMRAVLASGCENVWFELSFVRSWDMPGRMRMFNRSRLIFGSSAPRQNLTFEFAHFQAHLPPAQNPDIYGGNLVRLLEGAAC